MEIRPVSHRYWTSTLGNVLGNDGGLRWMSNNGDGRLSWMSNSGLGWMARLGSDWRVSTPHSCVAGQQIARHQNCAGVRSRRAMHALARFRKCLVTASLPVAAHAVKRTARPVPRRGDHRNLSSSCDASAPSDPARRHALTGCCKNAALGRGASVMPPTLRPSRS